MFSELLRNKTVRSVAEWLFAAGLAIVFYFFIQTFIAKTASISGTSMEPTLDHGDRCIVWVSAYSFGEPGYGDIVAFPYRLNPAEKYVKRVVGRPGDVVDLQDGRFYINDEPLDDAFSEEFVSSEGDLDFPLTVPDGHYFVLGDNRNRSKDSRYSSVGCIPKEDLMGKVSLRIWPLKSAGLVE